MLPVTWHSVSCLSPRLQAGFTVLGTETSGGHRALWVPDDGGHIQSEWRHPCWPGKPGLPKPRESVSIPCQASLPCAPPGLWSSSPQGPPFNPLPGSSQALWAPLGHSRQELVGQHRPCLMVFLEARIASVYLRGLILLFLGCPDPVGKCSPG